MSCKLSCADSVQYKAPEFPSLKSCFALGVQSIHPILSCVLEKCNQFQHSRICHNRLNHRLVHTAAFDFFGLSLSKLSRSDRLLSRSDMLLSRSDRLLLALRIVMLLHCLPSYSSCRLLFVMTASSPFRITVTIINLSGSVFPFFKLIINSFSSKYYSNVFQVRC